jgi:hypothetical protein
MNHPSRDRLLALNYAAAIFTSAFLLFQVQPIVSKHILPWFGGSAAVWTTCLLFFQTLLFFGYAYAHLINSKLSIRAQVIVHLALIVAACVFARVLPGDSWEPRGGEEPIRAILFILAISVGLPYFVLSGTGPLLQAWFAKSFPGRSPYRLYALSNVGSLLALLSYPFVFERHLSVPRQATFWTAGFILYGFLCAYAAWRLWQSGAAAPRGRVSPRRESKSTRATHQRDAKTSKGVTSEFESRRDSTTVAESLRDSDLQVNAPTWYRYVGWIILPMFATIVLMATTNHISTDIAVMPFLWIIPLALYLLTFIIAFDRPGLYYRTPLAVMVLISVYATALIHSLGTGTADISEAGIPGLFFTSALMIVTQSAITPEISISTLAFLVSNFATVFFICMLCHGELYRQRPDPRYLTSYYLMIAAGGALGGMFVTFIAPKLFLTYFEWELSLFIACIASIAVLLSTLVNIIFQDHQRARHRWEYAYLGALVFSVLLPSAVMMLDLVEFLQPTGADAIYRVRHFFGTLSVSEREVEDPLKHHHLIKHGVITHGAQFSHESLRRKPLTYYSPVSGVARAVDYYSRVLPDEQMRIGVVGLGAGSMAAYADNNDLVTFYEIDVNVRRITDSGRWFTYLADARRRGADVDIRIGDARLTLERELELALPQKYHILVLDAFSGDSVPVHLLTVEAFDVYLKHLSQATDPRGDGAILVHISNRYLDLLPVALGIAKHFNLHAVQIINEDDDKQRIYRSDWVILTRNNELAKELKNFETPPKSDRTILWTDTHSSLFDILK